MKQEELKQRAEKVNIDDVCYIVTVEEKSDAKETALDIIQRLLSSKCDEVLRRTCCLNNGGKNDVVSNS